MRPTETRSPARCLTPCARTQPCRRLAVRSGLAPRKSSANWTCRSHSKFGAWQAGERCPYGAHARRRGRLENGAASPLWYRSGHRDGPLPVTVRLRQQPSASGNLGAHQTRRACQPRLRSQSEYVRNQGDGWSVVVDALDRELEDETLSGNAEDRGLPYSLTLIETIGRRTGELHRALGCRRPGRRSLRARSLSRPRTSMRGSQAHHRARQ